jgi:hypothetical protein
MAKRNATNVQIQKHKQDETEMLTARAKLHSLQQKVPHFSKKLFFLNKTSEHLENKHLPRD